VTAVFASQTVTETQPLASDEGKKLAAEDKTETQPLASGKKLAAEDKTDDGKELANEVKILKQQMDLLQQIVTVLCHKIIEN
jgi:hypothetical protein